jgi:starvation-inducible DNA-binding protein
MSSVREQTAVPSAEDMVRELTEGHETVIGTIRTALATAQEAKDEATVGILASRVEVHDKASWMLSTVAG